MSSRLEIELTSKQDESTWTWRAAGAKQPKGTVSSEMLYDGAKVGDVCRAEAEFEIDGITLLHVSAPAGKRSDSAKRIHVVGPQRDFTPITSQLAGRKDRPKGKRRDRDDRDRKGRGEGREDGRADGRGPNRRGGDDRGDRRKDRRERPSRPERVQPSFKKLNPKDEHRQAVLTDLAPEERPIAEQVLRGGIPAVRQAIDEENTKAKAEGRPEINGPALVAVAEELLPKLKAAEWLDRAEAAKADVNEISLRDLRAVVTGADAVARSDQARVLAAELREALDRRTAESREQWVADITKALDEARVIRALRLSSRPPDAQTKFPAELNDRLRDATSEAMSPETAPDRWMNLLDAVSNSPVRRSVEPKGLPAEPGEALLTAAKQASGRIPALAKQLGVSVPPPPVRRTPPKPKPADSKSTDAAGGSSQAVEQ